MNEAAFIEKVADQAELQALLARIPELPIGQQRELFALIEQIERSDERQKSQTEFLHFTKKMWPSFIYGRHHRIVARAFERIVRGELKRVCISMPPRHALAVDTPIPTPNGWKTMGELQPGDFVFGPDGLPTLVIGKSEVFKNRQCWLASADDGSSVVCDDEHLWNVRLCRKRPVFKNKTAKWLGSRKSKRNPMLPPQAAVRYTPRDLLVDPYVLGVWLGDGDSKEGCTITMGEEDAKGVRGRFEENGVTTTERATAQTFGMLGVKVKLRALGVLGNKHIPRSYLCSSVEQRMALLHGLMDTDGNVTKYGQCFYNTSSRTLLENVRELLWSLGIKNSVATCKAKIGDKDYGEAFRISFYAKDIAGLSRKNERARGYAKPTGRYLSLDRIQTRYDTVCIKVSREDGLFIAGRGFLVTHNTKSQFASWLLPAWYLGRYPDRKVIQTSHTAELAVHFGRQVRNLAASEEYQKVFPSFALAADAKAGGHWMTHKGGEYFAIGVGGAIAGKGADLFIIDDPHSEQEAQLATFKPEVFDQVYEWYTSGPRQRLQPGAAVVVVMTRWGHRDLIGQLLKKSAQKGEEDEWEVIELPAIMPSGASLWPEYWPVDELLKVKADIPTAKWNAQYQQNPTAEEGAIVKRDWWQLWTKPSPPDVKFVIQTWDTAFSKTAKSNFSACTTWGIFDIPGPSGKAVSNIILLDAYREKLEFPELKEKAYEHYKYWKPDAFIVEARVTGVPLIFELRNRGIPVEEFMPVRGTMLAPNDKIARLNAISDIFSSKMVWRPEFPWADEVVEEIANFPHGHDDDFVDTTVMALMRYRRGGFIRLSTDEQDEDKPRRRRAFY